MLIECTLGQAETPVAGMVYKFERDRHGRFVANVLNRDHQRCLLAVACYREARPVEESPAPEGNPEPVAPPPLTAIKGIGAAMAAKLAAAGVTSVATIAAWTDEQVVAVDTELKLAGAARRGDWVGQAKALLAGTEAAG